ncbi:MAG: Uma2 family endonuclease [Planctomycetaceae bacterium]
MGLPQRVASLTPAEYLKIERAAECRHEYLNGEMFAMPGNSPLHSLIKVNSGCELGTKLKGRPCTAFDSDLRIRIPPSNLYTYPDLSVVCGELEFDDDQQDTVLNPTLLVEVLSDSTEAYDRGKKFEHYRRIAALREYVLISQKSPTIERYLRNPDETWTLTAVIGLDASIHLSSIDVTLSLAEVYDRVTFDEHDSLRPEAFQPNA